MGPQHAYGLAARLEQVAEHPLMLNQGTLYPALVRLEQKGWIKGTWQKSENNREGEYTPSRNLGRARWRRRPIAGGASPASSTSFSSETRSHVSSQLSAFSSQLSAFSFCRV